MRLRVEAQQATASRQPAIRWQVWTWNLDMDGATVRSCATLHEARRIREQARTDGYHAEVCRIN